MAGARVLLSLAGLVAGLALLEAALAARVPQRALPFNGERDGIMFTWGQPVHVNRLGFRERELASPKPAARYRVMVIGDSLTWGVGVAPEARYTERAEALLRRRFPQREIEVLNFGIPGASLVDYRDTLRRFADVVQPDLIVIGFCFNDPQPRAQDFSDERQTVERRLSPLFSALAAYERVAPNTARRVREALWHAVEVLGLVPSWFDALERAYRPDAAEWTAFTAALADIRQLSDDRHLPPPIFLVLDQGSSSVRPTSYSHPDPLLTRIFAWYERAAAAARAAGLLVVDVKAEIASQLDGQILAINAIDGHPSPEQHRVYAEKLAATIAGQSLR
jgi:lysophospholipase L1-like esterase